MPYDYAKFSTRSATRFHYLGQILLWTALHAPKKSTSFISIAELLNDASGAAEDRQISSTKRLLTLDLQAASSSRAIPALYRAQTGVGKHAAISEVAQSREMFTLNLISFAILTNIENSSSIV